ncbi:hypothetical protein THAOC_21917, partial [Thalassiosira oceanica]
APPSNTRAESPFRLRLRRPQPCPPLGAPGGEERTGAVLFAIGSSARGAILTSEACVEGARSREQEPRTRSILTAGGGGVAPEEEVSSCPPDTALAPTGGCPVRAFGRGPDTPPSKPRPEVPFRDRPASFAALVLRTMCPAHAHALVLSWTRPRRPHADSRARPPDIGRVPGPERRPGSRGRRPPPSP